MQRSQSSGPSWSSWKTDLRVHLWTSFVAACLEATAFFAFFDPLMQASDDAPPAWLMHRPGAYALGLVLFWTFTLGASALSAYLPASALLLDTAVPGSRKTT